MSDAIQTQGFTFEIGNGDSPLTYTSVSEITSFQGLDGQAAEIDVSHLQSPAKEYRSGLPENGTWSMDVNYLTNDPGQDLMRVAKASSDVYDFRITWSDGASITFQGFVQTASVSGSVDNKMDGSFSIRITGEVTGDGI